jgi:hypothetical protein
MFYPSFALLTGLTLALSILLPIDHAPVCLHGHPSAEKEYQQSYGVLIGHVVAAGAVLESKDYLDGTAYSVRVNEVLRGHLPDTLEVFSENSSGRFPMDVGSKYLLFLYRALDRTVVDNCGNSGLLSETASVLKTVRRLQRTSGYRR